MGIPSFFGKYLKTRNSRSILMNSVPKYVSSFSFDLNSLIHGAAAETYAYGDFADPRRVALVEKADPTDLSADMRKLLVSKMMTFIEGIQPREILAIAVDGVAPQAKITQQRQRRYRTALESRSGSVFDSNSISAGTDFMQRLDTYIESWIEKEQSRLPPKIIYSSNNVPGEGEAKIFAYMRSGEISGEGAHVVYGMDADLIMLSLLSPLQHIYLVRDDIQDVINIDALKEYITTELKSLTAIDDFVVMMYLLGNDFLPHSPALFQMRESLELMFQIYRDMIDSGKFFGFTQNNEIIWKEFAKFLKELAKEESLLIQKISERAPLYPFTILDDAFDENRVFSYDAFRNGWYKRALSPRLKIDLPFTSSSSQSNLFSISLDKIIAMTKSYLNGIAWTYRYYKQGTEAINQHYIYPYFYTPLLVDILAIADLDFQTDQVMIEAVKNDPYRFTPLEQLLAVIPPKSKDLIPKEVQSLLDVDSPILDLFPIGFEIDRQGEHNKDAGIVILPFVDAKRVVDAVNSLNLLFTFLDRYYPSKVLIKIQAPRTQYFQRQEEGVGGYRGRGRGGFGEGYVGRGHIERGGRGSYRGRGEGYVERGGSGSYRGRGGYRGRGEGRMSQQLPSPLPFSGQDQPEVSTERSGDFTGYPRGRGRGRYQRARMSQQLPLYSPPSLNAAADLQYAPVHAPPISARGVSTGRVSRGSEKRARAKLQSESTKPSFLF